jgi:hypothetical protein
LCVNDFTLSGSDRSRHETRRYREPFLNSPFEEPRRHIKFNDEGITDEVVESRRPSSYVVPITTPKKKGKQR